jgi:CHAT domain-containing protein
VLHPLLKHVGTSPRWIVSPDSNLWLVPREALTLPDGKYAVEKHQISYVVSGRGLASQASSRRARIEPPLVLADPDFDLGLREVRAETRRLVGSREPPGGQRDPARGFVRGRVARLPGTAAEARAIVPKLEVYARTRPALYTDRQALEGVFKAAHNPHVVVLSTHGFFLPEPEAEPADEALGRGLADAPRLPARAWENPLLRCGLLLAGCNNPPQDEGDDGVLTDLEVVGTDLRGTRLVVLSACQTGVGDVRNGELEGRAAPGLPARRGRVGGRHPLAGGGPRVGRPDGRLLRQPCRRQGPGRRPARRPVADDRRPPQAARRRPPLLLGRLHADRRCPTMRR